MAKQVVNLRRGTLPALGRGQRCRRNLTELDGKNKTCDLFLDTCDLFPTEEAIAGSVKI